MHVRAIRMHVYTCMYIHPYIYIYIYIYRIGLLTQMIRLLTNSNDWAGLVRWFVFENEAVGMSEQNKQMFTIC